jgi:hypothetical protein
MISGAIPAIVTCADRKVERRRLTSFSVADQPWQPGNTVIRTGNQGARVVSFIPIERLSEFVEEPVGGVLQVERI